MQPVKLDLAVTEWEKKGFLDWVLFDDSSGFWLPTFWCPFLKQWNGSPDISTFYFLSVLHKITERWTNHGLVSINNILVQRILHPPLYVIQGMYRSKWPTLLTLRSNNCSHGFLSKALYICHDKKRTLHIDMWGKVHFRSTIMFYASGNS